MQDIIEGNNIPLWRLLSITLLALAMLVVVVLARVAAKSGSILDGSQSIMFIDDWLDWCIRHIGPISIAVMAVGVVIAVELMTRTKEKQNKK